MPGELSPDDLVVGSEVVVEVGPIAHGGHCIARYAGRVLFVRHAIPGERVRARVTEGGPGDRFLRADAVAFEVASPDRVTPPCPYAGPAACGGCDFQHVDLARQRTLKGEVVREQFARLARLDVDVVVEAVPGDAAGLEWRTRVEYAVDPDGVVGLHRHRSHEVVPVRGCRTATAEVVAADVEARAWRGVEALDVVSAGGGHALVVPVPIRHAVPVVTEGVAAQRFSGAFEVSARGFWQVHPGAAATFVDTVLELLDPQPGDRCLDLYAGVGLFAAALADAVTPLGQVIALEADATATGHAKANLAAYRQAVVVTGRVDDLFGVARPKRRGSAADRGQRPRKLRRSPLLPERADLVVLDPPRTGAGAGVVGAIVGLRPRAVAYVACDPAALARDVATFGEQGYVLAGLRAFDAFPMTHHVECIALLRPGRA